MHTSINSAVAAEHRNDLRQAAARARLARAVAPEAPVASTVPQRRTARARQLIAPLLARVAPGLR